MSQASDEPKVRRILVALDGSDHSLAALEAAVDLARGLKSEVEGLFIEDSRLLRMAALPVASECPYPYDTTARLDLVRMERVLRAQAEQARRALRRTCERYRLQWSFRVLRGQVASQLLEAAEGADVLSIGRLSRPIVQHDQLGSTARELVAYTRRPLLLTQRGSSIEGPIVSVHHGADEAQQAVLMAGYLALRTGGYLNMLILAEGAQTDKRCRAQIASWLRGKRLFIRYQRLGEASAATLAQAAEAQQGGALVLDLAALPVEELHALLEMVECPVLLM